jgi:multiple sugar transport system permease protein
MFALRRARDLAAVAAAALTLAPLAWWLFTAFRPRGALLDRDGAFADLSLTLANVARALADGATLIETLGDSALIAFGSTAIALLAGLPAAYALSRFRIPGARAVLAGVLLLRLMPPVAIIVPAVLMARGLGLFDTRLAVMLIHALMNLPIVVLVTKSLLDDVPRELDDAARLDGAGRLTALRRVLLPEIASGLVAVATLCLLLSWTEFFAALFLSVSFRTLPVRLSIIQSGGSFGELAALSMLALAPAVLALLLVQRHLVRGLTLGLAR